MTDSKKVVLVTGASRGIGYATAKMFAEQDGYVVVGTATNQQRADEFAEKLSKEAGTKVHGFGLDIADTSAVNDVIGKISADIGAPLIVVNNAGITKDNLFLRLDEASWNDVVNVNLTGAYRVVKACAKGMLKARWGRVINLTSIVALTGNGGQCNYSAAKAGILGFTKSLAAELASRSITVNAVSPGFIATDMTDKLAEAQRDALLSSIPMGKMGKAEDIAATVGFLASDAASYITGETIHVNGGMYMS